MNATHVADIETKDASEELTIGDHHGFTADEMRANVLIAARAARAFTEGDTERASTALSALPLEDAVAGLLAFSSLLLRQRRTMPSLHETILAGHTL